MIGLGTDKNTCSVCFLVLSSSNNGLKLYIWTYFFWNMFTNWPIFLSWWGNAGRFILQKKKRNPPRKWACLWQGTVWWKRRERSCYSAGRLLVTRGKSLIWPPAALISPSQSSFSSLTLHIGPFLVLIVTPFFTLDVFFVLNHGMT